MLEMTTLRAGKFTPEARVGVETKILMTPFLKASSTIPLQDAPKPA
jgi:hypothetical protein